MSKLIRVWDQKNEQMYDLSRLKRKKLTIEDVWGEEHLYPMWGTGMEDTKAKPIFEGDLLKIESREKPRFDNPFLVKFIDGAFVVEDVFKDGNNWILGRARFNVEYREILGNKYQNPELMQEFALFVKDKTLSSNLREGLGDAGIKYEAIKVRDMDAGPSCIRSVEIPMLVGGTTGKVVQGKEKIKEFIGQ